MTLNKRTRIVLLALAVVVAGFALRGPLESWLAPAEAGRELTLSGNIEAHESELSFKTIQSRIVQLPFNEGQWVKQGTVVAQAEDADYAQQVAAERTVSASAAQQALRQADFRRYTALRQRNFVSAEFLDQTVAALKQADEIGRASCRERV